MCMVCGSAKLVTGVCLIVGVVHGHRQFTMVCHDICAKLGVALPNSWWTPLADLNGMVSVFVSSD